MGSNVLSHYLHLGQLGRSSSGDLSHPQARELFFQVIELLGELLFVLSPQFGALYLTLKKQTKHDNITFAYL